MKNFSVQRVVIAIAFVLVILPIAVYTFELLKVPVFPHSYCNRYGVDPFANPTIELYCPVGCIKKVELLRCPAGSWCSRLTAPVCVGW